MDAFVEDLREANPGRIRYHTREPGRAAEHADVDLDRRIERALDSRGIDRLYRHQVEAIEALRAGRDAVIATPTASGKSLVYTVHGIERALETGGRTLYVAPLRALINDQETNLVEFVDDLGFGPRVRVAQYTGQQSRSEKRTTRDDEPHVLLTTPDMLHQGILPHAHRLWEWFMRSLEVVVLDEIHQYRGVFGSHVGLVCRRLARVCERFDADPQFVCCSATIGNPTEHASAVTGRPASSFRAVETDTSATGPRHWVFWNPPVKADAGTNPAPSGARTGGERRSPHPETATLFCDLLRAGYQTLVFTTARQTAERYARRCADRLRRRGADDLADRVRAYQAALPQERREAIEGQLRSGALRGVWSTNALELGIDIGSLDAVLLDGYPGTRMATVQRAGRAGRGTDPSLVGLIAGGDQLDQYLMANPESFFENPPERAVVNPENERLLPAHVECAAVENWLRPGDDDHFGERFPGIVTDLESDGVLERRSTREGVRWVHDADGSPHQRTGLRTIEDREIRLIDATSDERIASLPFSDGLRDAHPGAIYHHQGRTYEVETLDPDRGRALLRRTDATHYTRALRGKSVTVEADRESRTLPGYGDLPVTFAEVTIRERIEEYVRYDGPEDDGRVIELPESLPETSVRTEALYFPIPEAVERELRGESDRKLGFEGAIHALEHGMIALFPLELLCDRRDVGGLSTPMHPHTGRSTIFIHDGHPGGVGLARGGYESAARFLDDTREMIAACPCRGGCPACIQSPHCGNANEPLAKRLAIELIDALRTR